jgi:hypothetical protein
VFWSRGWEEGETQVAFEGMTRWFTGKHVGEDTGTTRNDETVGYIVMEAGHATSDSIEIEAARGPVEVGGYVEGNHAEYASDEPFSTKPAAAVLSQVFMNGKDGAWAILAGISSEGSMNVAVDEDTIGDEECNYKTEQVDYIVFSEAGPVEVYQNY